MKRKSTSSEADVLDGYLRYAGRQQRIANKEVQQMAEMENLSGDVRRRRWKLIGHIMRKEPNSDCRDCINLGSRRATKTGQTKDNMEKDGREKGEKLDERTRVRYKSQRVTELVGGIMLRPYKSHGTKRLGEEGDIYIYHLLYLSSSCIDTVPKYGHKTLDVRRTT